MANILKESEGTNGEVVSGETVKENNDQSSNGNTTNDDTANKDSTEVTANMEFDVEMVTTEMT